MEIRIPSPHWLACLVAVLVAAVAPIASARQDYSDEGANACLECHETKYVMGIMGTPHADASDPRSPAARRQCQSCHGPSATHMKFPMHVANVHFGRKSDSAAEVQNGRCLECHQEGAREHWNGSAHGFEKVVCSTCHTAHQPDKLLPPNSELSSGCMAAGCHDQLFASTKPADFSHGLGQNLNGRGELSCAGCHNPHGPLSSARCADCHVRTSETIAGETPKAKRFHDVAARKGTECMRCHKGIAHPVPKRVIDAMEAEMERTVSE